MDYDFRNKTSPYDYRSSSTSSSTTPSSHPMYAPPPPMYPRLGQAAGGPTLVLPVGRHSSLPNQNSSPSGLGIRISIKPHYRINPPPQLSPQIGDIPRSNFQFDFDLERKILAELEKETPNWSRLGLENLPSRTTGSTSTVGSGGDPVVSKYVASGLNREAVAVAVANYGDNPKKVQEFVNGYNLLREMGFSSNNVAEVLLMYDNDTDKAIAHFLNNSS